MSLNVAEEILILDDTASLRHAPCDEAGKACLPSLACQRFLEILCEL